MPFKKKKKSVSELEKELEEARKVEEMKEEQKKPMPVIDTEENKKEAPQAEQEPEKLPQNVKELKEAIDYYNDKFAGVQLPLEAMPNLLLGILTELRSFKKK